MAVRGRSATPSEISVSQNIGESGNVESMRKPKREKSNTQRSEGDRMEALLEAMQDDFRAFGDGLETLDGKVDRGFRNVDQRFDTVDRRFGEVDKDLAFIKVELGLIRHELKQKVDRTEFKLLEARVARLEAAVRK